MTSIPSAAQQRLELRGRDLHRQAHRLEVREVVGRDRPVQLAGEVDDREGYVGVGVRAFAPSTRRLTASSSGMNARYVTLDVRTHREVHAVGARGVHDGLRVPERVLARVGHHLHRPPVDDVLIRLDGRCVDGVLTVTVSSITALEKLPETTLT